MNYTISVNHNQLLKLRKLMKALISTKKYGGKRARIPVEPQGDLPEEVVKQIETHLKKLS